MTRRGCIRCRDGRAGRPNGKVESHRRKLSLTTKSVRPYETCSLVSAVYIHRAEGSPWPCTNACIHERSAMERTSGGSSSYRRSLSVPALRDVPLVSVAWFRVLLFGGTVPGVACVLGAPAGLCGCGVTRARSRPVDDALVASSSSSSATLPQTCWMDGADFSGTSK